MFVFMSWGSHAAWKIPFYNPLGAAVINHEATEESFLRMRVIYTYLGISSQALLGSVHRDGNPENDDRIVSRPPKVTPKMEECSHGVGAARIFRTKFYFIF